MKKYLMKYGKLIENNFTSPTKGSDDMIKVWDSFVFIISKQMIDVLFLWTILKRLNLQVSHLKYMKDWFIALKKKLIISYTLLVF